SFRLDNLRGLSSLLVGETTLADTIASSSIDHLDLIPCGPVPPNPSELLASQKMKLLLEEVKAEYDIVIFDTPPVLAVADAQILANIVDGSILVIRSGQTEVEAAIKAKEALEPAQAKLLGTILNDHEKTADDYYYYYGTVLNRFDSESARNNTEQILNILIVRIAFMNHYSEGFFKIESQSMTLCLLNIE